VTPGEPQPSRSPSSAPPLEVQRAFWNEWDTKYRERSLEDLEPDSIRRGRLALRWTETLKLGSGATILEVGCANGWLCEHLVTFGAVTGTDIADEVIARAQTRHPNIRFLAGDFSTLVLPAASFDVVVCLETLGCVANQPAFLAHIADLLKPGGHLILTTQNRFVYERYDGVAPQNPGQLRHWLFWSELRRLLRPRYRILRHTTVAPASQRGMLRVVTSRKLDRILGPVIGAEHLDRVRETLGFGRSLAVLARRESREERP